MFERHMLAKLAATLGGLPVLGCHPGSPADEAGIRYGDIVMAVNGMSTPDWSAFIEARAANKETMKVELFRDGEQLVIELALSSKIDRSALLAEIIASRLVPMSGTSTVPLHERD